MPFGHPKIENNYLCECKYTYQCQNKLSASISFGIFFFLKYHIVLKRFDTKTNNVSFVLDWFDYMRLDCALFICRANQK